MVGLFGFIIVFCSCYFVRSLLFISVCRVGCCLGRCSAFLFVEGQGVFCIHDKLDCV